MEEIRKILDGFAINMAGLEAVQKLHGKKIDALWSTIQHQDKLIRFLLDTSDVAQKDMLKLHDVYYHVFPDKIAADFQKLEEAGAGKMIATPSGAGK